MIELEGDSFQLIDAKVGVQRTGVFEMPGYTFEGGKFIGALGKQADWGIYSLPPHTPTRVVTMIEDVAAFERPMRGNGTFILHSQGTGKVQSLQFDCDFGTSPVISYEKGDTVVYIGGTKGADVLSLTTPPFQDAMEIAVEPGSEELPQDFWKLYYSCLDK